MFDFPQFYLVYILHRLLVKIRWMQPDSGKIWEFSWKIKDNKYAMQLIKFSFTIKQDKRKLCEWYTIYIFFFSWKRTSQKKRNAITFWTYFFSDICHVPFPWFIWKHRLFPKNVLYKLIIAIIPYQCNAWVNKHITSRKLIGNFVDFSKSIWRKLLEE